MSDDAAAREAEDRARAAGEAARRLIDDPFLREALDEMVQMATESAITADDPQRREEQRMLVIAIMQLRTNLWAVFEQWRDAAAVVIAARAHE